MLNFHDFDIQTIAQFFEVHPHYAGIFTYLIVFVESMAVIGVIVPGMITMPAIGFLIGSSIIPAGSTFVCAIIGAITGDCLSYWLGSYFQQRIHRMWPFTRWPNLLVHSEKFFRDHGGKSVFIGRFVGPTRAMIPMVAGMLKMPLSRFLFAALPSAVIFAIGYMVPGVLLGALSLELPPKVATKFMLGALLVAVSLWLVGWLVQHFFKQIAQMLDYYIMQIWRFCQKHHKLSRITKTLADPKEPHNHRQLTLITSAIFIFILFLFVLHQVLDSGILVSLSYSVYYLLSSLRSQNLDNVFILFTMLGDPPVLLGVSGLVFLWLVWKKYWYVALHWFGVVAVSGIVITGIKVLMYLPRPGDILYDVGTSSFPSAHVALSLSFYGFLAVVIARELKASKRYLPYAVVGILVAVVAFSRIYLGAHWLTDILSSMLLGLVIVLVATVFYRRRHGAHFSWRKFASVISGIVTVVWLGYGIDSFNKQVKNYALIWPHKMVAFNDLTKPTRILDPNIPLYRLNRLGIPVAALNVMYVGELSAIREALLSKGWESQPITLDFQNIVKSFSSELVVSHLSIFTQLYHNKKVALLFTKKTGQDDVVLILRLWPSDLELKDTKSPLWIGSIEYNHTRPNIFSLKHFRRGQVAFIGATKSLAQSLADGFCLWRKNYPLEQQPAEMSGLHWDGKVLVVRGCARSHT